MTHGNNRDTTLKVAFTLLIFYFLGVGAIDPCRELTNMAVFEGVLDTFISFPANAKGAKWMATTVTDELFSVPIENYNEADYALGPLGLTIKNATTNKLSTAGYYTVECDGNRFSFKFLVVRVPTCSRSGDQLTCNVIYADSTYDPIAAIFTLKADGKPKTLTPQRTNYDEYTWISTATFTTGQSSASKYECTLTFGEPTEIQDPSVAMNAPTFSHKFDC